MKNKSTLTFFLAAFIALFLYRAPVAEVASYRGPPGMIFYFAGANCPAGSFAADGTSYLRSSYANLTAVMCPGGTCTWGSADGSHFYAADLRNRYLRGTGVNGDSHGGTTISLGSYQENTTAKNALALSDPGHSHIQSYPTGTGIFATYGNAASCSNVSCNSGSTSGGIGTGNATTGISLSSTDTETRPKTYGVTTCIWY